MSKPEKTRASGSMTEAAFVSFVKSALRAKSRFWKPISETIKKAKVARGHYNCNGCGQVVTTSTVIEGKRMKNIFVDHIDPVVDPNTGFSGWDTFVNRLFCEEDNLQLLCKSCHDLKSKEEREVAKERKKNND